MVKHVENTAFFNLPLTCERTINAFKTHGVCFFRHRKSTVRVHGAYISFAIFSRSAKNASLMILSLAWLMSNANSVTASEVTSSLLSINSMSSTRSSSSFKCERTPMTNSLSFQMARSFSTSSFSTSVSFLISYHHISSRSPASISVLSMIL